jgi:lipopolysaccharide export system permease protein
MKTADRYILLQVVKLMFATFAVGILVLSMARLIIILRMKAIDDQELSLVVQMLAYFLPNYFGFMLPFALFWACFMVWRRFSGNSEERALSAAGISHRRMALPLFGLGVVVSALNLFVYGWLEPHARYNYRALTHRIENTAAFLSVRAGVFTKAGHRTVFVNGLDSATNTFKGLLIYEQTPDGLTTQILAATGRLLAAGSNPLLRLENGNRLILRLPAKGSTAPPDTQENLQFATLDLPLLSDEERFYVRGSDEEELSIAELYASAAHPPPGTRPIEMAAQFNQKLIVILTALFLPLLALPMAQSGPRGANPLKGPLAFGIVILFQQLVDFGKVFAIRQDFSPAIALWPIFIVMALGSAYAFLRLDQGPRIARFGLSDITASLTPKWLMPAAGQER